MQLFANMQKGSVEAATDVSERKARDRAIGAVLHQPVLLPELARLVADYDRRPAQRFCREPQWIPPGVTISEDGRTFSVMKLYDWAAASLLGIRGCQTFETGSRRWRFHVELGRTVFAGVVDCDPAPSDFVNDYTNGQTAYVCLEKDHMLVRPYRNVPGAPALPKAVSDRSLMQGFTTLEFQANVEAETVHLVVNGIFALPEPIFSGLELRHFAPYCCVSNLHSGQPIRIESEDE